MHEQTIQLIASSRAPMTSRAVCRCPTHRPKRRPRRGLDRPPGECQACADLRNRGRGGGDSDHARVVVAGPRSRGRRTEVGHRTSPRNCVRTRLEPRSRRWCVGVADCRGIDAETGVGIRRCARAAGQRECKERHDRSGVRQSSEVGMGSAAVGRAHETEQATTCVIRA